MSWQARMFSLGALLLWLAGQPAAAAGLSGTIALGEITKDEQAGDLAAMQETYNIFEGFTISRLLLNGSVGSRGYLRLDLENINQDGRQALLDYRLTGVGKLRFQHDRYRRIFGADGHLNTERSDYHLDATVTPAGWLSLSARTNLQTREGDRLGYPRDLHTGVDVLDEAGAHTGSSLGRYDYTLYRYQFGAEAQKNGRGLAVSYEGMDFSDDAQSAADRQGHVVSLRLFGSDPILPFRMTHYLRAAFGSHELSDTGLDHTLATFQYVGAVRPCRRLQVRYLLHLNRVDDESTDLKTDYIRNEGNLTYTHRYGSLFGGYAYVTDDDDRTLTSSDIWEVGGTVRYKELIRGRIKYGSRDKSAEEDLTLLKDIEDTRFEAKLQSRPLRPLTVGAFYSDRTRSFPVLDVEAEGSRVGGFARLELTDWASVQADYSYADEDYDDRAGGFSSDTDVVTGRLEFTRIDGLRLAGGVTYLDIGKDLDIEKSILMFEGQYDLLDDYYIEIKYNIYNYDDYILLDRYYTANVVWMNIGYRFALD
jgi:hypothetical protein